MVNASLKYDTFNFPAGERQIRILDESIGPTANIRWTYESDDELMHVALLNNAIRQKNNMCKVHLELFYVPYARQDRACYAGEAFSLEAFAELINCMNFSQVTVVDPHSSKVCELIRNCVERKWWLNDLKRALPSGNILLIAPDKGAAKKIDGYAKYLEKEYIVCDKVRDPKTGHITKYSIPNDVDFKKYDLLLVLDDICDGGATFNILAESLPSDNEKWLFVSHGIFSKGTAELRKRYHRILTTDSLETSVCADNIFYSNEAKAGIITKLEYNKLKREHM